MTKVGGEQRGREEEEGGTERRSLLLSLHTFNPLLPSALANSMHYRALSPLCSALPAVLPLVSSPVFLCRAGGSGVTAWLWRRYLSLAWTCVPVPVCQLSSLTAACCLWNCGTSPQPRWTKCMDGKQGPDLHRSPTKFIKVHKLPFEKWDVGVKGFNRSCCHVS